MPVILFVILVILIAQLGFWDTFGAILGAAAMMGLFSVLLVAGLALTGYLIFRRYR